MVSFRQAVTLAVTAISAASKMLESRKIIFNIMGIPPWTVRFLRIK